MMSINSIPVNADNSFRLNNTDNADNALGNQAKESPSASQVTQTSAITKEAVDKLVETNDKLSTVSDNLTEESQHKDISSEEMEKALETVTSFLHSTLKQVDFSSDNNAGKTVITVLDKKTQEIINQFPSEKIISMAEKIYALHQEVESISGLIIDSHV